MKLSRSSMAGRLLIYILLASSVLTLLITILQLYVDYRQDVNSIETRLKQINESYSDVLAQGLWDLDKTQVDNMLKGILKFSDLQYLEVFSKNNKSFAHTGMIKESKVIKVQFPVVYNNIPIGVLRVDATLEGVYQRLKKKVFLILSSQSIKTFFISIFILFIVQFLITRHLVTMAYYASNLGIKNLDHVLTLQRPVLNDGEADELEMVVDAINGMRVKLLQDIEIQKKQESELVYLRNYLENIIDSMPSMLVGVDKKGRITQWNKTAEQITGMTADTAQGKNLVDAIPQMAPQMDKISESIRTRETIREQKQFQHPGRDSQHEDITIYPLIGNSIEGAVIRVDDITDKVRMEEMMIQSEKMLSVGGLAAGMAHEINNPLAGMMQNAEVIKNRLSATKIPANIKAAEEVGITMDDINAFMKKRGILRMLGAVNESGCRIAEIVENMLNFARKSDSETSSENMAQLLDDTLNLAATDYDLKKQYDFKIIEIKKEYDGSLPLVPCEGTKIQQVILNVLRNGAQAMQDAGIEKPVLILRTFFDSKQKRALVEIEDNGPGMEDAVVKRVFEPFFTTKPVGIGTGLGLSVSYFIITENHGGTMSVESKPGKGAKFTISLPLEGRPV